MFYVLLYVTLCPLSIAIILMGKRELIALLNLSSWCFVMVERLFLGMPRGCLRFVIVVFPDHTHLLFLLVFCVNFSAKYLKLFSKMAISQFSAFFGGHLCYHSNG